MLMTKPLEKYEKCRLVVWRVLTTLRAGWIYRRGCRIGGGGCQILGRGLKNLYLGIRVWSRIGCEGREAAVADEACRTLRVGSAVASDGVNPLAAVGKAPECGIHDPSAPLNQV